jgi:hypothetical protein
MPKATHRTRKSKAQDDGERLKNLPKYKTAQYRAKEERISEALKAYHDPKETDITNLRTASIVFDVSYSTLWDRNHGTKPLSENGGHNTRLNEAQEASLIWYMDIAIERGFPLRYDMVTAAAAQILKAAGIQPRLGDTWAYRWVEKQRKLGRYHSICTKAMDYRRKDALTPELVQAYFDRLQHVLEKYNIQIVDIYNVDEIGFRIGCIRSSTVITHKNIKEVSL